MNHITIGANNFGGRNRPIMKQKLIIVMLAAATTTCTFGCNDIKTDKTTDPSVGSGLVARPSPTGYTVLRKSDRAFTYLVNQGGTITVYDTTAGRPVISTQVPPQTLIRVDPKLGVFTGSAQVIKGPLPEKNTRELRLKN